MNRLSGVQIRVVEVIGAVAIGLVIAFAVAFR
jgi:hypothetical protein